MRRGNPDRLKAAETLKNPSTSRDMKRKRSVDVDHHRNDQQTGPASKTSEFAFFNKLKSSFGLSSDKVKRNPRAFEFRGTDKDNCSNSFSTPIYNNASSPVNLTRKDDDIEKDPGKKCSSGFNRDNKDTGSSNDKEEEEEEEDLFSVKRKRLNQWVKDTCIFPNVTSNSAAASAGDLVSLLLTRLFPGTDDKHPSSRFSNERTHRRTFLDSPGSKFLKRSHESYSQVDHTLLHFHHLLFPRDPKEWVYRPPLLTHKSPFPVEDTLQDSSLHFRNYNSLSLGGEDIGYTSSHDPSSALLLEWNASTRNTHDLQPSNHTQLITYPNASLADNPWSSDHSSHHDVVTREPCSLPLLSHYTLGRPATNQTSHFEHEFERHLIEDEDMVAANQNLHTFHHASDCLNRDYTYYHSPSNSQLDHSPFKVPGRSFPFSSISNSDLLEASILTTQSDRWWI